jgi:hypothetical protein
VVEASHEEEAANIGTIGQSDERDFCFALPNGGFRDAVAKRHKAFLDQSQSFLFFAMLNHLRPRSILNHLRLRLISGRLLIQA